ncbi:MAG: acetate kinase [Oscillospiraceae bacterium]|jgi:acetate kinase|nr:acetate kinase [Oscillospiraceae bacterium]
MNILAINAGSSSLKYGLINMKNEIIVAKGSCDKIGSKESFFSYVTSAFRKTKLKIEIKNHKEAIGEIVRILSDKKVGVVTSLEKIAAIGHRIAHGGVFFDKSIIINSDVIEKIDSVSHLAPLHNKMQIETIRACQEILGKSKKEVAVFDTAFHSSMNPSAFMFSIPYKYYKKYKIRRYGFHGLSHKFVCEKCAKMMNKDVKTLKLISCHLGSGSSIASVKNFKVVDTSMGFTPLDGLIMSTRSGAIDPSIITFLQKEEGLSSKEVENILNKQSGFLGVSGISSDVRDVKKAANEGHEKSILACNILKHQIIKLIGAYVALMNGCDAIIFTAGIGENYWKLREEIFENFKYLGIEIDKKLNKTTVERKQGVISTKNSKIAVFVIPTNEELMIAREAQKTILNEA